MGLSRILPGWVRPKNLCWSSGLLLQQLVKCLSPQLNSCLSVYYAFFFISPVGSTFALFPIYLVIDGVIVICTDSISFCCRNIFDILIVASGLIDKTTGSGLGVQESQEHVLRVLFLCCSILGWNNLNIFQIQCAHKSNDPMTLSASLLRRLSESSELPGLSALSELFDAVLAWCSSSTPLPPPSAFFLQPGWLLRGWSRMRDTNYASKKHACHASLGRRMVIKTEFLTSGFCNRLFGCIILLAFAKIGNEFFSGLRSPHCCILLHLF